MSDSVGCLAGLVPGAVGWRPAPDGVELAGADGRTLILFDADGTGRGPAGETLRLERASD